MKNILTLFLLLVLAGNIAAQNIDEVDKYWSYSVNLSGGIARFDVRNFPNTPKYEAADFSVTFLAHRRIKQSNFLLNFGIGYSEKFQRPSYFQTDSIGSYAQPNIIPRLDRDASSRNSRSINIPLGIEYELGHKMMVGIGIQGRYWIGGNNADGTLNSADTEYGIYMSILRKITNRLSIGLLGYSSLENMYNGYTFIDAVPGGPVLEKRAFNQYLHIAVRYQF